MAGSDPPAIGTCSGFEVRSSLPFATLRAGEGTPLVVTEREPGEPQGDLLLEWHARPGNPFHGRLLRDGARYAFWASDAGWYVVDPAAPSIAVSPESDPVRRELRLFGVPLALCAFAAGDVAIHASAIEIDGQAVLFGGPSMYGKTTLAGALAAAGHRLLSEDTTRCTTAGGGAQVYPGPAVLRLRSDVAQSLSVRGTVAASAADDRVQLVFDERLRGDGQALPLRAVIILREAAEPARLIPMNAAVAARDLLALTFRPPEADARAECFRRVVDMVSATDCLDLHRPKTIASLPAVVRLIEDHVRGS